jgi:hypothetical protein
MPPLSAPLFAPSSGRSAALPSTALTQVLVTAADVAGLVLAVDLARHGVDAVVLDGPPPAGGGAAAGDVVPLGTASQELLDDLGVLDRLIATAPRGRASSVMSAFEPFEVEYGALLGVLHERLIELGGGIHRDHTHVADEPDGARLNCYVDGPAGPITIRTFSVVRTDAMPYGTADERAFVIAPAPDEPAPNEIGRRLEDAYNLGWKLAAVLRGAPDWIVRTYHTERPAAGSASPPPPGAQPPSLSLPCRRPRPTGGGLAPGERAPDAPVLAASGGGRPARLATLLHGPHWTLLGYALAPAERATLRLAARPGLHVHIVAACPGSDAQDKYDTHGAFGDLVDIEGELRWAYGLAAGDWVLIRPDGLVAAIVATAEFDRLREHLAAVGLGRDTAAPEDPTGPRAQSFFCSPST